MFEAEHGPKDALWPTMVAGYKNHNPKFEHQVMSGNNRSSALATMVIHTKCQVVPGLHHAHLNQPDLINSRVVSFLIDKQPLATRHKL